MENIEIKRDDLVVFLDYLLNSNEKNYMLRDVIEKLTTEGVRQQYEITTEIRVKSYDPRGGSQKIKLIVKEN
jgi:hypothetical protein